MASAWLVMAVLVGPSADDGARASETARKVAFSTVREAKEAVSLALRESGRAGGRDPVETAPKVLAVYQQVGQSGELPLAERRRLQGSLRTRLIEQRDIMQRRAVRAAQSGSGGVSSDVQELIQLIQTTVSPDSWTVNGGRGTMGFYAPQNLLVIRQTAEVHEEIGGALRQLRR